VLLVKVAACLQGTDMIPWNGPGAPEYSHSDELEQGHCWCFNDTGDL